MMEQPSTPAPQKSNNGCLWAFAIIVTLALCVMCSVVGLVGFYYSAEIMAGINELVDVETRDPIDVVPAGASPASPAEQPNDDNTLPRGDNSKFSCGPEDEGLVYVVGGKMLGNTGVEGIGAMSLIYARTGGPLQPYYYQVTDQDFENLAGIRIDDEEEIFNDFGQYFVYCENETWKAVKVGRDSNNVWFGDLSYVEANYNGGQLYWVLCNNDSGDPGTFVGTGSDCENYTSTTLSSLYNDDDFKPYIPFLEDLMSYGTKANMPSNGKLELYLVFLK